MVIIKGAGAEPSTPSSAASTSNMNGYEKRYRAFSWEDVDAMVTGLPDGNLNIAYEAVDRHLGDPGIANKTAICWLGKSGQQLRYSYLDLARQSNRFANVLDDLGIKTGATVVSLLGRVPELYIAALGTLKNGCVYTPLFSVFGPEPIRSRLEIGGANVLLTNTGLYNKKVASWWRDLPDLQYVLLIDAEKDIDDRCRALPDLMAESSEHYSCYPTASDDVALVHFTSGTTGKPKGVVHIHNAVKMHIASAYFALDLQQQDIYWCTADPGWVTGTSYGIIAPLCLGVTMLVDEAEFDVERWYQTLEQHKVTVWYTAPTAIRMLMKAPEEIALNHNFDQLRFVASVGEPLNSEAVPWSERVLGTAIHDNWWQTETGAIMISNFANEKIKPGSMGRPLPGIEAAIVEPGDQGQIQKVKSNGDVGELALRPGWPSMFRDYLNQHERYQQCFRDGWYLSGDLARRDEEGYYWFVGRADDLIKSAGHLIGPFEVENVLMQHESVAEAAVIGKPDPLMGEMVKAFVTLRAGFQADTNQARLIQAHARKQLGPAVAPREIEFQANLPKTRSGKLMRRLLKARELGLPEGDTSSLEANEEGQRK